MGASQDDAQAAFRILESLPERAEELRSVGDAAVLRRATEEVAQALDVLRAYHASAGRPVPEAALNGNGHA